MENFCYKFHVRHRTNNALWKYRATGSSSKLSHNTSPVTKISKGQTDRQAARSLTHHNAKNSKSGKHIESPEHLLMIKLCKSECSIVRDLVVEEYHDLE